MYHLILLKLDPEEVIELSNHLAKPLQPIRIAMVEAIPLPLEPDASIGEVGPTYYNAETGRWTASIALSRLP